MCALPPASGFHARIWVFGLGFFRAYGFGLSQGFGFGLRVRELPALDLWFRASRGFVSGWHDDF